MQHTITHTCGHTSRINLAGPRQHQEDRATHLRRQPCWSCRQPLVQASIDRAEQIATQAMQDRR